MTNYVLNISDSVAGSLDRMIIGPLLGFAISKHLGKYSKGKSFIDLFSGAGGLSEGFRMNGKKPIAAIESEKAYFATYLENLNPRTKQGFIHGDIC